MGGITVRFPTLPPSSSSCANPVVLGCRARLVLGLLGQLVLLALLHLLGLARCRLLLAYSLQTPTTLKRSCSVERSLRVGAQPDTKFTIASLLDHMDWMPPA
eukprot:3090541-Rhodomonas_salina.1